MKTRREHIAGVGKRNRGWIRARGAERIKQRWEGRERRKGEGGDRGGKERLRGEGDRRGWKGKGKKNRTRERAKKRGRGGRKKRSRRMW